MLKVACFGEVLWDVFPDHKAIGGAPLNVALRLNSFGVQTSIISKIGIDGNGEDVLEYIEENGLSSATIQRDKDLETGVVNVMLDKKGSASYEIKYPVAWDKIELTAKAIATVQHSNAFIYGSLASRDATSRSTLFKLLPYAKLKVFDVNLRSPHYTIEIVKDLMYQADIIKLNDEELMLICTALGCNSNNLEEMILFLSKFTNTKTLCITKGANGATLYNDNQFYNHSGYKVKVMDTVGAGDSFLATLIYNLLLKNDYNLAISKACCIGSLVASKKGANAMITKDEILQIFESSG